MAYPDRIKQRALELCSEGYSPAKASQALRKELREELDLPDERTIRRWRNDQRRANKKERERKLEPVTLKGLEKHFERLANILSGILGDDLVEVEPILSGGDWAPFTYSFGGGIITYEQLSRMLDDRIEEAWVYCPQFDMECLIEHLNSELQETQSRGLSDIIRENPYQIIETFRVLAKGRPFKGTCPVCKDLVVTSMGGK